MLIGASLPSQPQMTGIPVGRIPRQEALVLLEPHWGAASIRRLSVQIQEEGFMAKWGSVGIIRDLTDNPVRGEAGMETALKSTQTLHYVRVSWSSRVIPISVPL